MPTPARRFATSPRASPCICATASRCPCVARRLLLASRAGECVVLGGPSGAGKSSILKMVYGNYAVDGGQILIAHDGGIVDIATASPRTVLAVRRATRSAMSASSCAPCRASPRSTSSPSRWSRAASTATRRARQRRGAARRGSTCRERLWSLPPATFSGGEQQRVNIARGFIADHPLLLLDEPTASLDADEPRRGRRPDRARRRRAGVALARHLPRRGGARRGRRPHHRRHRASRRKAAA